VACSLASHQGNCRRGVERLRSKNQPENPAARFLASARTEHGEKLAVAYAEFLLHEANAYQIPVSLGRIVTRFGLQSYNAPLPGSRALTTPALDIFVNAHDRDSVQRFSVAHELIELLFMALKDQGCAWMSEATFAALWTDKERLCELGAAELLMPMDLFKPLVEQEGVSMIAAERLASQCQVSLTAALRRIVDTDMAECAVIRWRYRHSSRQFVPSAVGQLPLFGDPTSMDPPRKLRVERVYLSSGVRSARVFIPRGKSIEDNTLIFRAYEEGVPTSGYDTLDLANLRGRYYAESRPVAIDGERMVISLVHLQKPPETEVLGLPGEQAH
jgi:Zn-dependent peptidase ImmA (M78 family)